MIKKIVVFALAGITLSSCVSSKVHKELEGKYADLKRKHRKMEDDYGDLKKISAAYSVPVKATLRFYGDPI